MSAPSDLIAELRNGRFTTWTDALVWCERAADHITTLEAESARLTEDAKHYPTVAGENMRLREENARLVKERDEAKILAEYLFGPEEMAAEHQLRIAAEAERDEARRIEAAADSTYTHWRGRAKTAEADREALRVALKEIAFMRPGGPCRSKLVERIERVAIDALDALVLSTNDHGRIEDG